MNNIENARYKGEPYVGDTVYIAVGYAIPLVRDVESITIVKDGSVYLICRNTRTDTTEVFDFEEFNKTIFMDKEKAKEVNKRLYEEHKKEMD